jgi:predicted SAM-dependent methyltransferase
MLGTARKVWRRTRRLFRHDQLHLAPPQTDVRSEIARRYLRGHGLEIGALHNPLAVPPAAKVRYVDRMSVEQLRQHYPELAECTLVPVDILDDGEQLTSFSDGSKDFIIANHFLEHCQDFIGTLKHFFRVLRPGGVLYAALPDKRYTFDHRRAVTPLEHHWTDHLRGPEHSRREHYVDYVRNVHPELENEEAARRIEELLAKDYSIHFHVWTQREMLSLFLDLQRHLPVEFELVQAHGVEVIFVLRKSEASV